MRVDFFCPRWGFEHIAWPKFITWVKQAGYVGVEWFPYSEEVDAGQVKQLLKSEGLQLSIVMTVLGVYDTVDEYLGLLRQQLTEHCATYHPEFVTAQTGREYFNLDAIEKCLECCHQVTAETGTAIYQETHRNKWAYAAHVVKPVLQKHTNFSITLDASHWFCVSESYLEDQQEAVELAVSRARHVHARVGHTQGSQVTDPARPEYAEALQQHLQIWDKWIDRQRQAGAARCTITPEFGPFPYLTHTNAVLPADLEQWRINLWMKELLSKRYNT
jgi:sugar phosphate isomerase/epimerase